MAQFRGSGAVDHSMAAVAAVVESPLDDVVGYVVIAQLVSGELRFATNSCCSGHLVDLLDDTRDHVLDSAEWSQPLT